MRDKDPIFDQPDNNSLKMQHGRFYYWWSKGVLWISKTGSGKAPGTIPLSTFEIADLMDIFRSEQRAINDQYRRDVDIFGPREGVIENARRKA